MIVEKFEKTGSALAALCREEDAVWLAEAVDGVLARYGAVRENVRSRSFALDDAVQESAQFSDKLDGMLASLNATAEQVRHPDPVAAHPQRIRSQIEENCALMNELEQKHSAYQAVKQAADEIVAQASPAEPALAGNR